MLYVSVFHAARCDVLLEEVFAPCHAYVSPSLYHQQCRYQACRCGSRCLCTALSHYAYICAKHHVMINFRAHVSECGALLIHKIFTSCPVSSYLSMFIYIMAMFRRLFVCVGMVCLGGMMYHPCTSACGKTCQSISRAEVCDGGCAEGCSCTEGTFYDHARQRCVLLYVWIHQHCLHRIARPRLSKVTFCFFSSQCHCYFMGSVFQPGDVSFSSSGPWCVCIDKNVYTYFKTILFVAWSNIVLCVVYSQSL